MAIFEVYVPDETDALRRVSEARFLPDRTSIMALLFPAIWLIWHRLWLALAFYAVVSAALMGLTATPYYLAAIVLLGLPGLYVFLEGNSLIAQKWESEGFTLIDMLEASDLESAEIRWFANQGLTLNPAINKSLGGQANTTVSPTTSSARHQDDTPAFGLFAED